MGAATTDTSAPQATAANPSGVATVADIERLGEPALGATAHGATAVLETEDGSVRAWLQVDGDAPVGFMCDTAHPEAAIKISDAQAWSEIADGLGMKPAAPSPPAGADAAATPPPPDRAQAHPHAPAAPAPPSPAAKQPPGTKALDPGGSEDDQDITPTGIMVALIVPEGDATDLMPDMGENVVPAADLHLTLTMLGDVGDVEDEAEFTRRALDAINEVAQRYRPIEGVVSGVGRFSLDGGSDAFYLSYDSPALSRLREDLVEALTKADLEPSQEHGFTPHITLTYLSEGEESPLRRAAATPLVFDALTFCFGENRVATPLTRGKATSNDPTLGDQYQVAPQSTAPSDSVDGKAAMPPQLAAGSYVSWAGGSGRIDLVVTNGTVPGVSGDDVEGTSASPAARVVVYERAGGGWKATSRKAAVKLATLKRIPPLRTAGRKAAGLAAVVEMHAQHAAAVEEKTLPAYAAVEPRAVRTVYDRGLAGWPGQDATEATREEWATGRVKAFLTAATRPDGTGIRDTDLLPEGHPTRQSAVVVTAEDVTGVLADIRSLLD